jgi:hypothetical protein
MTHDLETTLNASVSSSPGNKKIWTTPVVQPLWGADAAVGKAPNICESSLGAPEPLSQRHFERRWGEGGRLFHAGCGQGARRRGARARLG